MKNLDRLYLSLVGYKKLGQSLLILSLCFGLLSLAEAQETAVSLKNITSKTLSGYKTPKLIDAQVTKEKLRQLRAGTEALIHMSEMISEVHARKAMQAQIDSLKATITQLEQQVEEAALIDYSFPAPLPRRGEKRNSRGVKQQQADHAQPKKTASEPYLEQRKTPDLLARPSTLSDSNEVRAMSATQTSRLWGAIERASFRNDKMAVIHKISREHYLTTQQAELFVESLTFSKDRRDAIKLLYPRLVDPSQVNVLYSLLDQPAHRREVKQVVDQVNMNRRLQRAQ